MRGLTGEQPLVERLDIADVRPGSLGAAGSRDFRMTLKEFRNLVLAFARTLYVNGQATDQTVGASERLARALGLQVTIMPRWGELQLKSEEKDATVTAQIAADPTGVNMDRVASAMRVIEDVAA